jgi:N-acetyl-anhydromuramyl-L-alanine amidase AmpD
VVGKPRAVWRPADWSNYTAAYRGAGQIDSVVIHVTQGSYASAVNWFQTPGSGVSAHYVVRSYDGQIAQCVDDTGIAWHAGTWRANRTSLSIEHEGYFDDPTWFTDEMYHSSAMLVAHLCGWWGIPINRRRILGHYEVSYTDCPGPWWWWDYYMDLVWSYAWG